MSERTIFDRLREMRPAKGKPLSALIVEACDVGDELVISCDAAFQFLGGIDGAADVRGVLLAALNRAHRENGDTPTNGAKAA